MSNSDLYFAFDFGASATKISVSKSLEQSQHINNKFAASDIEFIDRSRLKQYYHLRKLSSDDPLPESHDLWVEASGRIVALGKLARNFEPLDSIRELKYERSVYKALGLLSYFSRFVLGPRDSYRISLAVTLPWEEFSYRERFKEFLLSSLKSFTYRGEKLNFIIDLCIVRQEGFGLSYLYKLKYKHLNNISFLLFGHRNLSFLGINDSSSTGASPLLGFHKVFDQVSSMVPWLNRDELVRVFDSLWSHKHDYFFDYKPLNLDQLNSSSQVYKLVHSNLKHFDFTYLNFIYLNPIYPSWKDIDSIQKLAQATNANLRKKEVLDIHNAINTSLDSYWNSVVKYLSSLLKNNNSTLVISGGAACYLLPYLYKYFNIGLIAGCYSNVWELRSSNSIYKPSPSELVQTSKFNFQFLLSTMTLAIDGKALQKGKDIKYKILNYSLNPNSQVNVNRLILSGDLLTPVLDQQFVDNDYVGFSMFYYRFADVLGLEKYLKDKIKANDNK
jgi:hypothetical protein